MSCRTFCLASVLLVFAVTAEETPKKQKPLFPVAIDHEFPGAEHCFNEVRDLILGNYYSTDITEEALYWAAIEGMLRHISPPEHPDLARIWTAAEYDRIYNDLKGVQVSLGIKSSFSAAEGSLTVTSVMDESPAQGVLQAYDRILRINGEELQGRPVSDIDALLKGEPGSKVELTVVRDVKVFDIALELREFKSPNLTVAVLPKDVGYIAVRTITADIAKEIEAELEKFLDQQVGKIILDLRHNTGGVFMEALRIAELFLGEKKVLLRTLKRPDNVQNYVSSNTDPFGFDMVVLTDDKTASSCEIIVGALQDQGIATIVGTKTYGKGIFEQTFKLTNEFRVKFIIGAMYTPRGKAWQSKGVLPDFSAAIDEKTYTALARLDPAERLNKDVPMLTAYKMLTR